MPEKDLWIWKVIVAAVTPIFLALMGFASWVGRISSRVTTLEDKTVVTTDVCKRQQIDCQKVQASEFKHGEKRFDEIVQRITKADELSEQRHNQIMDYLMEGKR